jgi:hypothetical protein
MSKLIRIIAIIGLMVVPTACKSEESARNRADRGSEQAGANSAAQESAKTDQKTAESTSSQADFERNRDARVTTLRVQRDLTASQTIVISALAAGLPLTGAGKADVNEKLQVLQTRLDDAGNAIQDLKTATADDFKAKDKYASDVIHRLNEARDAAWKALDEAPRNETAS